MSDFSVPKNGITGSHPMEPWISMVIIITEINFNTGREVESVEAIARPSIPIERQTHCTRKDLVYFFTDFSVAVIYKDKRYRSIFDLDQLNQ